MDIRRVLCCVLIAISGCALFQSAQAQSFGMAVGGGDVSVWRLATGEREQLSGVSAIGVGDTLFAAGDGDVSIQIESGSKVLVKGGSVVALGGQGGALDITLDDGQVFLDRGKQRELASVRILAKGYAFTPVGTAAAVKAARQGAPTVAVLRGSVQMQSAQGESISIGARQFGTVNSSGQLVSGELNEKGVQQLEAWTGVKAETPPQVAQTALPSSPENNNAATDNGVAAPQSAAPAADAASDPAPAAEQPAQPAVAQTADGGDGAGTVQPDQPVKQKTGGKGRKKASSDPSELAFELSAGMTTVDGEQWTRIALGVDIPIWKFGVFLDLELFIDTDSKVSDKGWDFKNNAADAILRKIRYVRFGQEEDPLFIKFGGLSNVTLGYGLIMDRFTNMLRYPDEKLLGLQFYLDDISAIGISLQTLISDFAEIKDDGSVYAARLAVRPLKPSGIFFLDGLAVGGTFAIDANTHAPARKFKPSGDDAILRELRDRYEGETFFNDYKVLYNDYKGQNADDVLARLDAIREDSIKKSSFSIWGLDVGLPIINTDFLSVVLYAQSAFRADTVRGWGTGAPGVAVKVWKLSGNLEYRKVEGRFTPSFFDMYYLDERYSSDLLEEKSVYLDSVSLNGGYGRIGMDVFGALKLDGSYQYMVGKDGKDEDGKDQRFEISAGLGEKIISHIPKISLAEVYMRNSNIGGADNWKYDRNNVKTDKKAGFFDHSPYLYWGYRAGFEITAGASLIWDYRYGWKVENGRLVPDNQMLLQTALRF